MTKPSTLDRRLLLGVASIAMLMSAIPAHAQVADDVDLVEDEVIATGIRQSIEDSLELKRNAGGIVEAITAEDIGKLPDVSIADSLARLPGVTAQRVRGRAQRVSIRGLGPDFSLALLNGREIVSASNNRGVEFDQFPSELIGQGIVYKTPQADLAATGLAGVVDLRTIKPLDYSDTRINLSARYVINDNGKLNPDFSDDGYRLFGSVVTQNDAGTIGASLGVTHESNPTQFFQRNLKVGPGQTNDFDGTFVPRDNPRSGVESREFERTSVAGSLQFEPTEDFSLTLDAFYSDFNDSGVFRGVETPLASWANVSQSPEFTGGPGFASAATFDTNDGAPGIGIANFLRTDTEVNEVETLAFGINFKNRFTDRLTLELDAGHSTLSRTDIDYESYAGTAFNAFYNNDPSQVAPVTFTFDENGEYSISTPLDYTSPSNVLLTTPGGWGGPDNAQVGFVNQPDVDDELTQLEAEIDYEINAFNLIESVTVGARHSARDKTFLNQRAFLRTGAGFTDNAAPIPAGAIIGQTDSGSIGLDIIAYDPSSFLTDGTYRVELANGGQDFEISEDINSLYAMLNLGGLDDRLFGNIGLQYIDVDQASTGLVGRLAGPQQRQTGEASYDDWLPTVNLGYRLTDEFQVRGAFGESVTRPRLDDLAASTGVGINPIVCEDVTGDGLPDSFDNTAFNPPGQLCLGGGGGNPFLRPYASTNYDASAEWFFSPAGALSVAVFHKDLSDYIDGGSAIIDNADFAGEILGSAFVSANPNASVFSLGGPVNSLDGSLTGVEVSLSLPFDDVIDMPIQGFGFNGNFGYTDSSLERPVGDDFQNVDIPGFSEETANGEIYYENMGWQARVNVSYRSEFVTQIVNFDQNLLTPKAKSRTTVDAQLGYEFQSGALEGLNLRVEAYNLTDEPFITQENQADGSVFPSVREDYGRIFNFTVAKTF